MDCGEDSCGLLSVTVNGSALQVKPGVTILEMLKGEGIHIPHLCYDHRVAEPNANCGLCVVELVGRGRIVKACKTPLLDGMEIITESPLLSRYRRTRLEELLADHNADCLPPCQQTCPAGIDIQGYLRQVAMGNFHSALKIIKERNPFPLACGRVCPHPCEAACRRQLVDSAVAINPVKRFVADADLLSPQPYRPRVKAASGKRIAIVGAGPSGLSAAYYAALEGHQVTIYEHQEKAGGMMRYGIPDYRLPQDVLDREIQAVTDLGVKLCCNHSLGTHLRLEQLQREFDAVYLAVGAWEASSMRIDGEESQGVWRGIHFLEQVAKGKPVELGGRVTVVGGGNTAVDCARTALRMGAEVTLIYRRSREEMPAEAHEVEAAIEEGVNMVFQTAPTRLESGDGGRVAQVHCVKMALGEPDRSGRRRPEPQPGSDFSLECGAVIGAIGQKTNTRYLWDDLPVDLNRHGDIQVRGGTLQTSVDNIFAGGDCVTGPATVIQAVAAGRRAAEAMSEFLSHGRVSESADDYSCSRGSLEDLPQHEFERIPTQPRAVTSELPLSSRLDGFREVESALTEEAAMAEAARCLRCGCSERYGCDLRNAASAHQVKHEADLSSGLRFRPIVEDHPFIIRDHNKCISCGLCINACDREGPSVLGFYYKDGKLVVGTKAGTPLSESDCVSCGQCVVACPCGALDYRREFDRVTQALNEPGKRTVALVAPAVRSALSSEFGVPFDKITPFIAGLLKKMGFDMVFDVSFAADLTILEEATEFLGRFRAGERLPQFTSCCPGWVNFAEQRYPEILPLLSTCKSPQQMFGATVKNHLPQWLADGSKREDLYVVSVMPCLAKKGEAAREEFAVDGNRDIDAVLTTSELVEMVRRTRLDLSEVEPQEFDAPYASSSGAAVIFGVTGGVAEAALRMGIEAISGDKLEGDAVEIQPTRGLEGFKSATLTVGDLAVRLAVVSGLANVEPLLKRIAAGEDPGYDLIEVMACPGGCIAGAGNPAIRQPEQLSQREAVLRDIDRSRRLRKSQDNPDIVSLYREFYQQPNSPRAHKLLHTHYRDRRRGGVHGATLAESAYPTRRIEVRMGGDDARELLATLQQRIAEMRLERFVQAGAAYGGSGEGIEVTVDGRPVSGGELSDINAFLLGLVGDCGRCTASGGGCTA